MTGFGAGRGFAERNRFGRVGRIPMPTPFLVGDVNAYVLFPSAGDDALTLVDAGVKSPEAFDALRHAFKEFGWPLERIERILLTHAHMDHYGQARRLRDLSGARVYASALEAARMRTIWSPTAERTEGVLAWFRRWGVPEEIARYDGGMADLAPQLQDPLEVDVILEDGESIPAGDLELQAVATPGHCEGHLVYYEPELRVLFSGDHLLTDISPVPLLVFPKRADEPRPKALKRFMASLERVERLDCRLTFPAHGGVIPDHHQVIASYRLHHERRKLQIMRKLRGGPLAPFELAKRVFPHHYATQIFFVMSEVIGHLDLLLEEGVVALDEHGGVVRAWLVEPAGGVPGDRPAAASIPL